MLPFLLHRDVYIAAVNARMRPHVQSGAITHDALRSAVQPPLKSALIPLFHPVRTMTVETTELYYISGDRALAKKGL